MIRIDTGRTTLHLLSSDYSQSLLQYRLRNREHLALWEPLRDSAYYEEAACKMALDEGYEEYTQGRSIRLWGVDKETSELVGCCNFTNIVRGPFQACYLGFSVDAAYQGKGYMREMLEAALDYVFETAELHRVMANHMPSNTRSAQLLKKLGFEQEGVARSYLKINGWWEDHVLTARVNPAAKT